METEASGQVADNASDTAKYFDDSAAYDGAMGRCSRVAGSVFLDWLAAPPGLAWLDVGCGTGVFTELVRDRAAPGALSAVDVSEGQIAFARTKPDADKIDYRVADALTLPFDDGRFDVSTMALVIQFVSDPAKAVSEMMRVLRPGGLLAYYVWPEMRDGHPMQPMTEAVDAIGVARTPRPGTRIRTIEGLTELLESSGLDEIQSQTFDLQMIYENFDDFWMSQATGTIRGLSDADTLRLKAILEERLPADARGRIVYGARVNAIRGCVPQ